VRSNVDEREDFLHIVPKKTLNDYNVERMEILRSIKIWVACAFQHR
jgi:hypothetical protein